MIPNFQNIQGKVLRKRGIDTLGNFLYLGGRRSRMIKEKKKKKKKENQAIGEI